MKKPWRKVKIFGVTVPVFKIKGLLEVEEAYGLFQPHHFRDESRIVLEERMETDKMTRVLLHEMLHAALHYTYATAALEPGTEEIIVDNCARVIADNFKLTWK